MTSMTQGRNVSSLARSKFFGMAARVLSWVAALISRPSAPRRASASVEPTRVDELPAKAATKEAVAELSLTVLAQHQIFQPNVRIKAIALGDLRDRNFIVLANCRGDLNADRARAVERQLAHEMSFGLDARLRGLYWRHHEA